MVMSDEVRKRNEQPAGAKHDQAVMNKFAKIFFDAGKSDLKPQYNPALDDLLKLLNQYPDLSIEISGFASAEGTEEMNRELSNKRAIAVLDYLNHRGIVRRRIVAKGYGASKDQTATKEEGRRVEVRMVQ